VSEPATDWQLLSHIASTWGGYANLATAIFAGLALWFAWSQLGHQSRARDFQAFAEMQRDLGQAWERFRASCESSNSSDSERLFHFGQLVSFYETACYMFNNGIVSKNVKNLFKHQVIEVFVSIVLDDAYMDMMRRISSGENTCEEIVRFFREHRADYARHWAYLERMGLTDRP
jgi:hypothetical protein